MNNKEDTGVNRNYFREYLTSSEQHPQLQITYTVHGGAPGEELTEEVVISGEGDVYVHVDDELDVVSAGETSGKLEEEEVEEVFQSVESSLSDLVSRSEAQFVPGSLVGSITLETDQNKMILYFDIEESYDQIDMMTHDQIIERPEENELPIQQMVREFTKIEKKLLVENDESKR